MFHKIVKLHAHIYNRLRMMLIVRLFLFFVLFFGGGVVSAIKLILSVKARTYTMGRIYLPMKASTHACPSIHTQDSIIVPQIVFVFK